MSVDNFSPFPQLKIHMDRLLLTRATGVVMERSLNLLGIRTVERM